MYHTIYVLISIDQINSTRSNIGFTEGEMSYPILVAVRPIFGLMLSGICRSRTHIERQLTPLGGLIGGVLGLPPSKTIISRSICVDDNVNKFSGRITSSNSCWVFRFLLITRLDLRWSTVWDFTSRCALAAIWVRRELGEVDLENTWTHEGMEECRLGSTLDVNLSTTPDKIASVWQLLPFDRENWFKG